MFAKNVESKKGKLIIENTMRTNKTFLNYFEKRKVWDVLKQRLPKPSTIRCSVCRRLVVVFIGISQRKNVCFGCFNNKKVEIVLTKIDLYYNVISPTTRLFFFNKLFFYNQFNQKLTNDQKVLEKEKLWSIKNNQVKILKLQSDLKYNISQVAKNNQTQMSKIDRKIANIEEQKQNLKTNKSMKVYFENHPEALAKTKKLEILFRNALFRNKNQNKVEELNSRNNKILELVKNGYTKKAICEKLNLSLLKLNKILWQYWKINNVKEYFINSLKNKSVIKNKFKLIDIKNITEKDKYLLKKSGIYRIWIVNPKTQKQLSYIGIGKNIFTRLRAHWKSIQAIFQNKETRLKSGEYVLLKDYILQTFIFNFDVSVNYAFYQKLWMKIVEYNLILKNIYFEFLEEIKNYQELDIFNIEKTEQNWIKYFGTELQGLNGIFVYEFKYDNYIKHSKNQTMIEKIKQQKSEKSNEIDKIILNAFAKKNKIVEWIYYQSPSQIFDFCKTKSLKEFENMFNIFENYCNLIIEKVKPTYSNEKWKILIQQNNENNKAYYNLKQALQESLSEKLKIIYNNQKETKKLKFIIKPTQKL